MMNTIALWVGWAILLSGGFLLAAGVVCAILYYPLKWMLGTGRQWWHVLDYALNKRRYRKWLATDPKRDRRVDDFLGRESEQVVATEAEYRDDCHGFPVAVVARKPAGRESEKA